MLELLIVTCLGGLFLSLDKRLGRVNPFQIYFGTWLITLVGFAVLQHTLMPVRELFWLMLLTSKMIALTIVVVQMRAAVLRPVILDKSKGTFQSGVSANSVLWALLVLCVLLLPVTYFKALQLTDGLSIFSVNGFIKLRIAIGEGQGFGLLRYAFVLSFVVASVALVAATERRLNPVVAGVAVLTGLAYAFLTTGRTPILQLAILLVSPLVLLGYIGRRGVAIGIIGLATSFVVVAALATKGISEGATVAENTASFLTVLRGYTVAPLAALYHLVDSDVAVGWGGHTFRTIFALMHAVGLSDTPPVSLVREFVYVPDATNVYTIYGTYFRDFGVLGFALPPLFLVLHWALYGRALQSGGVWLFFYCASLFPLVMQFFQDQYFSLLSTWVQIIVWYCIIVVAPRRLRFRIRGATANEAPRMLA